jgi:excinuclease ABC subunit B
MRGAIDETNRRRSIQQKYNDENGITPTSVKRLLEEPMGRVAEMDYADDALVAEERAMYLVGKDQTPEELIARLEKEMFTAAEKLEFERAAELRDRINELKKELLGIIPT